MSLQDFFDLHGTHIFTDVERAADRACREVGHLFLETAANRHDADTLTLSVVCSSYRIDILLATVHENHDLVSYDLVIRDENDTVVNALERHLMNIRRNRFTDGSSMLVRDVYESILQAALGSNPQPVRRSALIANVPFPAQGTPTRSENGDDVWGSGWSFDNTVDIWEPAAQRISDAHDLVAARQADDALRAIHEQQQREEAARQANNILALEEREEEMENVPFGHHHPEEVEVGRGHIRPLPIAEPVSIRGARPEGRAPVLTRERFLGWAEANQRNRSAPEPENPPHPPQFTYQEIFEFGRAEGRLEDSDSQSAQGMEGTDLLRNEARARDALFRAVFTEDQSGGTDPDPGLAIANRLQHTHGFPQETVTLHTVEMDSDAWRDAIDRAVGTVPAAEGIYIRGASRISGSPIGFDMESGGLIEDGDVDEALRTIAELGEQPENGLEDEPVETPTPDEVLRRRIGQSLGRRRRERIIYSSPRPSSMYRTDPIAAMREEAAKHEKEEPTPVNKIVVV